MFFLRCFNVGYHVEISKEKELSSREKQYSKGKTTRIKQNEHSSLNKGPTTRFAEEDCSREECEEMQATNSDKCHGNGNNRESIKEPPSESAQDSPNESRNDGEGFLFVLKTLLSKRRKTEAHPFLHDGQNASSFVETHDGSTTFKQDASISSHCCLLVLIAFTFSIIIANWLTSNQTHGIDPIKLNITLTTAMFLATLLMIWILSHLSSYLHPKRTNDKIKADWKKKVYDSIPVVCLLVFLIVGLFRDLFPMSGHYQCLATYIKYKKCGLATKAGTELAFGTMRLIFMCSEFFFICIVHKRIFRQTWYVCYSLYFIMGVTLAAWFDTLMFESRDVFDMGSSNKDVWGDFWVCNTYPADHTTNNPTVAPALPAAADNMDNVCLAHSIHSYHLQEESSSITYPVHIEFGILVVEQLLHLLSTVTENVPIMAQTTHEGQHTPKTTKNAGKGRKGKEQTEHTPLLPEQFDTKDMYGASLQQIATVCPAEIDHITIDGECIPVDDDDMRKDIINMLVKYRQKHTKIQEHSLNNENYPSAIFALSQSGDTHLDRGERFEGKEEDYQTQALAIVILSLLTAVVIGAGFIVAGIVPENGTAPPEFSTPSPTAPDPYMFNVESQLPKVVSQGYENYIIYEVVYLFLLAAWVFVAYAACEGFNTRFQSLAEQHFDGLHMLLVVSSLGLYLKCFLSIISGFAFHFGTRQIINEKDPKEDFPESPPDLPPGFSVANIVCHTFVIWQVFIQTPLIFHAGRVRSSNLKRRLILSMALIWLAVGNMMFWIVDSFIQSKDKHFGLVNEYYYGEARWKLLDHMLWPFTLFYRFTSFLFLMKIVLVEC